MAEYRPARESRQRDTALRAATDRRIRAGADAIDSAMSYGLVHSLEEAIERNRTRGWADDTLVTFRLESDDEVRAAWAVLEQRKRDR
jgi:hypothetical protein